MVWAGCLRPWGPVTTPWRPIACNSRRGSCHVARPQGEKCLCGAVCYRTPAGDDFCRPIYLICFSKVRPKESKGGRLGAEEAGSRWRPSGVTPQAAPLRPVRHREKKAGSLQITACDDKKGPVKSAHCAPAGSRAEARQVYSLEVPPAQLIQNGFGSQAAQGGIPQAMGDKS